MTDMIARGRVRSARIRGGRTLAEIEMADGEERTRVELLLPMGMSAVPEAGADVLVLQIGGPDHLVALQADAAGLRAPGLGPGDIALRDRRGQQVTLNADGVRITGALRVTIIASGDVSVETPTQVTVTAPEAHFTGNVTIDGSIVVGGGGGASTLSGDLTMTGTFILDGVTQNTHRHTNVQPGGGTSGGPVN